MKKIVLGLTLMAVLVGVSYVKSLRGQSARREAFQKGERQSQKQLAASEKTQDSLKRYLADKELQFADSMTSYRSEYMSSLDSLKHLGEQKDQTIDKLQSELKKTRSAGSGKKSVDPRLERERKIVDYYRSRYARLPKDLTEYEQKVALNEIREETASHFSISLTDLKNIRKKYKLEF